VLAYITRSFPLAHPMSEAFTGAPVNERAPGRIAIRLDGVLTERYTDPHITIYATYAAPENIEIHRLYVEVPGTGMVALGERVGNVGGMAMTMLRPGRWQRYVRALCWQADQRWVQLHREGREAKAAQMRDSAVDTLLMARDVSRMPVEDEGAFPADTWQTGYVAPRGER
jgi:hypothetical protein